MLYRVECWPRDPELWCEICNYQEQFGSCVLSGSDIFYQVVNTSKTKLLFWKASLFQKTIGNYSIWKNIFTFKLFQPIRSFMHEMDNSNVFLLKRHMWQNYWHPNKIQNSPRQRTRSDVFIKKLGLNSCSSRIKENAKQPKDQMPPP